MTFKDSMKGDKALWAIMFVMALVSLLAVYSSTYNLVMREKSWWGELLVKQSGFLFLGFLIVYVLQKIPVKVYRKLAVPGLILSIILLLCVFIFKGDTSYRRTVLPGIGSFQPSDFAKVALVVYLAKALDKYKFNSFDKKSIKEFCLKIMAPLCLVIALIGYGHTSTAIILLLTSLTLVGISTISYKFKAFAVLSLFVVGFTYYQLGGALNLPRHETVKNRISRFMGRVDDDSRDKLIQPDRAKLAIASGGIFGQGPGKSKQRTRLSEAYNDFIYAIIVEEYGIAGGILVIMLYLWLFFRVVLILKKCTKMFYILMLSGLILLIMLQAATHIAVSVGLFPVTGQTLPVIGVGGTSILAIAIIFGILLSVSRVAESKVDVTTEEIESLYETDPETELSVQPLNESEEGAQ